MKVTLKYITGLAIAAILFVGCDNGTTPEPSENPRVTAPAQASSTVGATVSLTFNVSAAGGYASSSITATGGNATVTTDLPADATSGDVVIDYTPSAIGTGTVELVVTDTDGLTGNGTAIVNVSNTIQVNDNITTNTTWEDGKTYILGGRIAVESGATLTIEGGAVIKGEAGTGSNASALLIARGATLNANGTAAQPIIFTSVADEVTPEDIDAGNFASPNLEANVQGLWGGLIVLGNAPISAQNSNNEDVTELQIEGIPSSDTNGLYGGNDATDNSGTLTYISIRHGGSNIGEGNEINGLTLGGVGSGTTINHIEVVANQDDGIEFFGGTVNVTDVLIWNNGDDAIDTDQAWAGTLSNVVIVSPGDSPFELDGPEGNYTSTGHTISNATIYAMGNGSEELIDVDINTDVTMSNLFFFGIDATLNTISSDYPDYAANTNGYTITGIEAVIPDGSAVADIFTGGLDAEVTAVADVSGATVGATLSEFAFTWARVSGALSSIGL